MTYRRLFETSETAHTRRQLLGGLGSAALLIVACDGKVRAQPQANFTPEMFGARGDGRSDDYEAFRRLAAAVNQAGGGLVRFGRGKNYLLDRYQVRGGPRRNDVSHIVFNRCNNLTLDLNGSTIHVKGDFHRGGDTRNGRASFSNALIPLMLVRCSNVRIENGALNGHVDRMTRDPRVAEFAGHGMAIDGCSQVLLQDLHIHHFSSDGIRLGITRSDEPCAGVTLNRVRLTNNARQGLTNAGGSGVVATGCAFSDNGHTDSEYRHPPSAGVDIEPIRRSTPSDFRAISCRFDDNVGAPVVAGNPDLTTFIELIDCSGRASRQKRMLLAPERAMIRGGSWHNIQIACAYGAHHNYRNSISIEVSNGTWTGDDPGWAPIYDLGRQQPQVWIHGNRFELRSPRPFTTTYLFQCANPNHRFENNQISVAKSGHSGSGNDLIGNFQTTGLVRGNRWSTDARAPQRFVNNYEDARRVEGESFSGSFVGIGMG